MTVTTPIRQFSGARLVIATHNRGKLEEIAHLLKPYAVQVVSAGDLGLPEPAETASTFAGNARIKAHAASTATQLPALADDSGLEVDALDGAPGVWTADWAETPSGRDFPMAMARVHDELLVRMAKKPWSARFRCTLVLAWPDGYDAVFEGKVDGEIVWPMRGHKGHGFDPVFRPAGHEQTFGELDRWEKNRISHRSDAFRKLIAACFT